MEYFRVRAVNYRNDYLGKLRVSSFVCRAALLSVVQAKRDCSPHSPRYGSAVAKKGLSQICEVSPFIH